MQDSELQRLVDDVKAGRCALILGPEIFTTENGQGIQAYIRAQLFERFGEQIAAYYERDGFFLLKNPEDKPEMQDEVQHLYKSLRPAEDLLRQIVEVPFSLVLQYKRKHKIIVRPDGFKQLPYLQVKCVVFELLWFLLQRVFIYQMNIFNI